MGAACKRKREERGVGMIRFGAFKRAGMRVWACGWCVRAARLRVRHSAAASFDLNKAEEDWRREREKKESES